MEAHAAAYRKRYAFVVGEESELTYMTKDSTGVFTPSSGYRFNDHGAHTTYRYPLEAGVHVCYALWHAHLAQQVLLEASSDGEQWVVLQDTAGKQIGSQNYYDLARVLPLEGAEAIYVRISDSMPEDGFGGAILTDIPVTLDVMYGAEDPLLLPPIGEQDEGAYLRVRGGHWQVAGPESLVSRVYTYSFTVGTNAEKKYLEAGSTGHLNASCRFNDNERVTVYRYRLANAALVRSVLWTATLGQQLRLECSANGEDWVLLDDAGAERRPFARATYDLTKHLNLLAFDEVYVRISDSAPDDGFGGAISRSGRVDLRVERCEPPIGF
jgi:hypothetical protein